MNDTYVEVLIKRNDTMTAKLLRALLLSLTIVFAFLGLVISIFLIPAVVFGILFYFVRRNTSLEFEYLYLDRELTIDKILARTKRKKAEKIELDRVEIIAPVKSYRLDSYKNKKYKVVDYSSGETSDTNTCYAIYYNGITKYLFEPTPAMLKAMQMVAPRKIFTD